MNRELKNFFRLPLTHKYMYYICRMTCNECLRLGSFGTSTHIPQGGGEGLRLNI